MSYSKSSITDIVTEGDRETEKYIRQAVAEFRPDDGFVGEEFEPLDSSTGLTWVVDPVDGTVNYLYGLAPCAVSIAITKGDPFGDNWQVIVAVIASIFDDQVYSACVDQGSFLNGIRLKVGSESVPETSLVCTGLAYLPDIRVKQARVLTRLLGEVRDIRRIGCASLELCALAAGNVDFYYDRGLQPWDYMAGTLIAREAGAIVRGKNGAKQPNSDLTIAGNSHLFDVLGPKIENWLIEEGL